MTRTPLSASGRPTAWRERVFVLAGPGLALFVSAASVGLGAGAHCIGPIWMVAIAWTVAASFAAALWSGFRHRDWSAFHAYEFPDDDGDLDEWSSRTGRYQYLRDREDRLLHDDDHLRNHDLS